LKGKERREYLLSLQQWQLSLEEMGASTEAASGAIDSIRQIQDLPIGDLFREAFQTAALGQKLGVDVDSQRMADLLSKASFGDVKAGKEVLKVQMDIAKAWAKLEQAALNNEDIASTQLPIIRAAITAYGAAVEKIKPKMEIAKQTMNLTEAEQKSRRLEQKALKEQTRLGELDTILSGLGVTDKDLGNLKMLQFIQGTLQNSLGVQTLMLGHMLTGGGTMEEMKDELMANGVGTDVLNQSLVGGAQKQIAGVEAQIKEVKQQTYELRHAAHVAERPGWFDSLIKSDEHIKKEEEEAKRVLKEGKAVNDAKLTQLEQHLAQLVAQEKLKAEKAEIERKQRLKQLGVAEQTLDINKEALEIDKKKEIPGTTSASSPRSCVVGAG
ncbi:MAG: hypothetical protein ACRD94_08775, partial [Nitrosopumilaceae archaeon]